MSQAARKRGEAKGEPVRVLCRGLRAQSGVHLTLRALREAAGKTQLELTELAEIDQADISRLESREHYDDCQLSTLQRYIAAIGGKLELVAAFGDMKIIIAGVGANPSAKRPADKPLQRARRKASRR